jgi:fructose-1,6-bisphosphatase/inositol monophosphatase family enzyme
MLIVEEAGGVVRTWTGEGPDQVLRTGEVLAGAPHLVDALLRLMEQE